MRFPIVLLAYAAVAAARPSAETSENDLVLLKAKAAEADFEAAIVERDGMPILDARIDAHEKEGRTVNLSPANNPRDGLLPRQCTGSCTCRAGLLGLYCGYCTVPYDAVTSCRSGSCFNKVYQCGSGSACCSYGYRRSCARRQGPCNG